jgi:uncharacterized protein (DUF433 family)
MRRPAWCSRACHLFVAVSLLIVWLMDYRDRIVIEPAIRFGKPCVRGSRITVGDVLTYLASGMREEDILADFPQLTADDIRACLVYAAERERRLVSIPAG